MKSQVKSMLLLLLPGLFMVVGGLVMFVFGYDGHQGVDWSNEGEVSGAALAFLGASWFIVRFVLAVVSWFKP